MSNYCKTCSFWGDPIQGSTSLFAVCNNPAVEIDLQVEVPDPENDEPAIFTGKFFGCVHHRERRSELIDLGKPLK